jgi:hypothetical protein
MRERLREPIDSALDEAGDLVEAQAERLRDIGDRLGDEQPVVGAVVVGAAGGVEKLSGRVDAIESGQVVDVAHDQARRRGPLVFAAGGAVVGLLIWAVARFVETDDRDDRADRRELDAGDEASDEADSSDDGTE